MYGWKNSKIRLFEGGKNGSLGDNFSFSKKGISEWHEGKNMRSFAGEHALSDMYHYMWVPSARTCDLDSVDRLGYLYFVAFCGVQPVQETERVSWPNMVSIMFTKCKLICISWLGIKCTRVAVPNFWLWLVANCAIGDLQMIILYQVLHLLLGLPPLFLKQSDI